MNPTGEFRAEAAQSPAPAAEKIRLWERRLLDLSLRNGLVNLRLGGSCLPIAARGGEALMELLAEGRELSLVALDPEHVARECPAPEGDAEEGDKLTLEAAFALLERAEANRIFGDDPALDESPASSPHASLPLLVGAAQLEATAKRLFRAARTAMDESGTGTLFAGAGMLRWVDDGGGAHFAPLALIPVALARRRDGWTLSAREGETEVNVTLLEKLRREFEIDVDELARRDAGDLRAVLSAFRRVAEGREGWAVLDRCALANFAYGPFLMWNDLRTREQKLLSNPITSSLITGIRMAAPEALEPQGAPLLPLPTDATQLAAVEAARRGESFVLHGPPGTGKSQTITTMIANLLLDGKRVLFVAEKQAALDVVKARLDDIGIGEYCVALHAAKADTRSALSQLQRALELPEPPEAGAYPGTLARMDGCAEALDALDGAMHAPAGCGISLYDALQRLEALADAGDLAELDGFAAKLTPEGLEDARLALRRMVAAGRAVGHPASFPLKGLDPEAFEPEAAARTAAALDECAAALEALREAENALADAAGWERPVAQADHAKLAAAASDAAFWATEEHRRYSDLSDGDWLRLVGMADHFVRAGQLRGQLARDFEPEFFDQDGEALYGEWKAIGDNPLLRRLRLPGLARRVNGWARREVSQESLWVPLRALQALQAEEAAAKEDLRKYQALLGADWRGEATDWPGLLARLKTAQERAGRFKGMAWLPPMRKALASDPEKLALAREVDARLAEVNRLRSELGGAKGKDSATGDWIENRLRHCRAARAALGRAGDWLAWLRCAGEARALGLGPAVDAYEAGMDHDALLPAFEKALCAALARAAIDGDPALEGFTGRMTEARAAEYRALEDQARALARTELRRRLYERRREALERFEQTPALSRLRRACASKRPGRSLRQLFEQLPDLLGELCGCMLMSPVSVAQFLPDALEDFDAVIFDEASQLLTCRAVGALSRAKAAIVVGDPNQMPPTTFFAAAAAQADDPDLEDLESVLDDCLAVGMPSRSLLWHYRSRHESLIAFSNRVFYDERLFTFPSADAMAARVRSVFLPDGVFERSAGRVNRPEARAVVAEIARRAADPELSRRSLGVVTFNLAQQNLIDDMLSEAAVGDAALAAWLEREGEPLFVKNLENVQGDERDVILFSVGYGPDGNGAVHMNFGPLNREGGWRRLNVAVTRAREEMLLFTSMRPEDIRLGPATPRGVAALREFMAYAASGGDTAPREAADARPDGIADGLCAALEAEGWRTARDVGCSGFRVSVAVAAPGDEGRYRLGVLLDDGGAAGQSARDREIGRVAVLERLGWRLARLYALDWRRNRQGEIERLLAILNAG